MTQWLRWRVSTKKKERDRKETCQKKREMDRRERNWHLFRVNLKHPFKNFKDWGEFWSITQMLFSLTYYSDFSDHLYNYFTLLKYYHCYLSISVITSLYWSITFSFLSLRLGNHFTLLKYYYFFPFISVITSPSFLKYYYLFPSVVVITSL